MFGSNFPFYDNSFDFLISTLTDIVTRSYANLFMLYWKKTSNLVSNIYFWTGLSLLKICSKWLLEKHCFLLKAANPINHLSLEISHLWQQKQTFDVECLGLRRQLYEYSPVLPLQAYKLLGSNWQLFENLFDFLIGRLPDTVTRS